MKTFVKLANSKSTSCRSLDLHCLPTSLGKQQWEQWTDYWAKRENYQAGRIKLARVCEGRTHQTPEQQRPPIARGFCKASTKSGPAPALLNTPDQHLVMGISEPTKAAIAASASLSHLSPAGACSCVNSNLALPHASPRAAGSSPLLLTNFSEVKGQKMSTPLSALHPTLPAAPLSRLSHGHSISC